MIPISTITITTQIIFPITVKTTLPTGWEKYSNATVNIQNITGYTINIKTLNILNQRLRVFSLIFFIDSEPPQQSEN